MELRKKISKKNFHFYCEVWHFKLFGLLQQSRLLCIWWWWELLFWCRDEQWSPWLLTDATNTKSTKMYHDVSLRSIRAHLYAPFQSQNVHWTEFYCKTLIRYERYCSRQFWRTQNPLWKVLFWEIEGWLLNEKKTCPFFRTRWVYFSDNFQA